jgi:CRISPR-associated protein Csx16
MRLILVTRHAGTIAWAKGAGLRGRVMRHLDPAALRPGDVVIGNLPLHLVEAVLARQARFVALAVDRPAATRGRELSAAQMAALRPRLVEYRVEALQLLDITALVAARCGVSGEQREHPA